jgi:hypothetical protein
MTSSFVQKEYSVFFETWCCPSPMHKQERIETEIQTAYRPLNWHGRRQPLEPWTEPVQSSKLNDKMMQFLDKIPSEFGLYYLSIMCSISMNICTFKKPTLQIWYYCYAFLYDLEKLLLQTHDVSNVKRPQNYNIMSKATHLLWSFSTVRHGSWQKLL